MLKVGNFTIFTFKDRRKKVIQSSPPKIEDARSLIFAFENRGLTMPEIVYLRIRRTKHMSPLRRNPSSPKKPAFFPVFEEPVYFSKNHFPSLFFFASENRKTFPHLRFSEPKMGSKISVFSVVYAPREIVLVSARQGACSAAHFRTPERQSTWAATKCFWRQTIVGDNVQCFIGSTTE